ncbi:MAG TPA: heparinase II/III family protein [Xanthobacteraceae bacterium]|nr:heparinase II/III family protein [Xanthobacteraceae bacterium]
MVGVSIAEGTRLSLLLVRRGLRNALCRLRSHPLLRWSFIPGRADRLVIAPQDLRTADTTRASEVYAGRFAFAGKVVICDGRSPFEIIPPSDEWAVELLSFGWLRHLRAAESGITRANARALVDEWITLQGAWHPIAWRPDVLARRLIAWFSHAPLILHDADDRFYRRFLRSISRQLRYLRRTIKDTREGLPRLEAVIALAYGALCLAGQMRQLRNAIQLLSAQLERQILPDGGHISRNPGVLVEILLDLLPLRQAFAARNVPPPAALNNAIDRMMPMLRFFRHGDGNFAHFNGMGPTAPDLVATVLRYDDARGAAPTNAPHSGYQRLETKNLLVLMDTGAPPPLALSHEAHAGCLSFELSSRQHRIVVNCGLPAINRETWRQVTRATAAHSTAVLDDTSSCRFLESSAFRKLIGTPIIGGPRNVTVSRDEQHGTIVLRASHDGYADRFQVVHQRTLMLAPDGSRLDGEDIFLSAAEGRRADDTRDDFAVRFHLHPTVKANRLADGRGAMLVLPNKEVWNFDAYDHAVEIEDSVYLGGPDGPRRTVQIVIYGHTRAAGRVHWSFTHVTAGAPDARRARGDEPELPLIAS